MSDSSSLLLNKTVLSAFVTRYFTVQKIPVSKSCDARRDWYIGDFLDWLMGDDVGGEQYRQLEFEKLWNAAEVAVDACAFKEYGCTVRSGRAGGVLPDANEQIYKQVSLYTIDRAKGEKLSIKWKIAEFPK